MLRERIQVIQKELLKKRENAGFLSKKKKERILAERTGYPP